MNGSPLIVENRLLGWGDSEFNDPNGVAVMILLQPIGERSFGRIDHASDHSQVGFL